MSEFVNCKQIFDNFFWRKEKLQYYNSFWKNGSYTPKIEYFLPVFLDTFAILCLL